MATRKRTLYEVLQVARNATDEVIRAAYETRLRALGDNAAPEVVAEKTLLREAFAILSDAVRRKLYDDKLRQEALATAGIGGDVGPKRSAVFAAAPEPQSSSSPLGWMVGIAVLVAVGIGGSWTYLSHKRAAEALRIEELRRVEQARQLEIAVARKAEADAWAKAQYERQQEAMEAHRRESERRRDDAYFQAQRRQYERQETVDARQRQMAEQRAESEKRRQEQESLRRSQLELQRQKQYLQELERNRGMKF